MNLSQQNAHSDKRFEIYRKFHCDYLEKEEAYNSKSAHIVLNTLFNYFKPESVLDVGCGIGTWLSVANSMGVTDISGIEGPWLNGDNLRIAPNVVSILDLERPFDLERKFELVISLEVAEHLSETAAENFIESLVRHGDIVLFSAAIPFQGGHHHLNEQWQSYWAELFDKHNYRCLDFLQRLIWDNVNVFYHIRQNMLLFVSDSKSENPRYQNLSKTSSPATPLSVVHPQTHKSNIYLMDQLMQIKQKYDAMMALLMKGGTFISVPKDNSNLDLKRIASELETSRNLNDKGVKFYQDQNFDAAESQFQQAIELDPDFAEPYNNLSVLYWQKGLSEKAFVYVTKALRRNPEDLDTIINFGNMCKALGFPEKAREALEAFLQRNPITTEIDELLKEVT